MTSPVVLFSTVYVEVDSGLPAGPLRRISSLSKPVKMMTGFPLLVRVSSAPVSVSSEISMGLALSFSSISVTVMVTV